MHLKMLSFLTVLLLFNTVLADQVVRNIPYTYDKKQMLDVFLPGEELITGAESLPAAIVIHGGGWSMETRSQIEFIAVWLASQGFVVINVDYSLAPENKWPAQISDVIQGVWWLKKNAAVYNINPNKILAVGGSAGGHLASMLGQSSVNNLSTGEDSEVHGIVSFAGPWNLTSATTDEQNKYINMLLSADTVVARALASPIYHINSNSPPTLIFHGTNDDLVPFNQSQQACDVYASKGLTQCFLVPMEGQGHSLPADKTNIVNNAQKFLNWWRVN